MRVRACRRPFNLEQASRERNVETIVDAFFLDAMI